MNNPFLKTFKVFIYRRQTEKKTFKHLRKSIREKLSLNGVIYNTSKV